MNIDQPQRAKDATLIEHLVPEADRLDQATPTDPAEEEQSPLTERRTDWADDADHLDQQTYWADTNEDDYPHQPSGEDRF